MDSRLPSPIRSPVPPGAWLCVREAVAKPQAAVSLFCLEDEASKKAKAVAQALAPGARIAKVRALCAIHKSNVTVALLFQTLIELLLSVMVIAHASASMPSCTPTIMAACLANGGSGHAHTMNSCPEGSASVGDLRDHAVRLMNRRDWQSLC